MESNSPFQIEFVNGIAVLASDNTASDHIRKLGRLDWDGDFNSLPEIQALQPGQVVFDIGAWWGDTTKVFLDRGCEVHAFEARYDNYICLLHNCPQANCYNMAVGHLQRVSISMDGGNTGAYSVQPGERYTVALDSLLIDRLHFLKIDVEGAEMSVLAGAEFTIWKHRPIIHIEVNPQALAKFGFKPEDVHRELNDLKYTSREVFRYGEFHWDLMATPKI